MRRLLLFALAAGLLAGCVYSDTRMIDERTAIVTANGTASATMAEVRQKILLEAAQTTVENGYDYFYVATASDTSRSGALVLPGSSSFSGRVNHDYFGSNFYGSTTTSPGQTINYFRPGQEIGIKMYYASEITDEYRNVVWDARSILKANEKE